MITARVFVRAAGKVVGHPAGFGADGEGEVERSFGEVNGKGTERGSRPVRQPIVINQDEQETRPWLSD